MSTTQQQVQPRRRQRPQPQVQQHQKQYNNYFLHHQTFLIMELFLCSLLSTTTTTTLIPMMIGSTTVSAFSSTGSSVHHPYSVSVSQHRFVKNTQNRQQQRLIRAFATTSNDGMDNEDERNSNSSSDATSSSTPTEELSFLSPLSSTSSSLPLNNEESNVSSHQEKQDREKQQRKDTKKVPYRPLGPKLTATKQLDDSLFRSIVQYLAELSLQDYQWRTDIFQQNEANRMMEQSMAQIRYGNDETTKEISASYIRPMDAPIPGPLGQLELYYVNLLYDIFHEEQIRAKRIIASSGSFIRPSKNILSTTETKVTSNTADSNDVVLLGPLGRFEKRVVDFLKSIQKEEMYRVTQTKSWRPIDVQPRGPIGELEFRLSTFIDSIRQSEMMRYQLSTIRNQQQPQPQPQFGGGRIIVRPIDIPGPLGELELQVSDIIQAEVKRVQEKRAKNSNSNNSNAGSVIIPTVIRPKDASYPGPLGIAEANAYATIQSVSDEETKRLKAIQRTLSSIDRPMDTNQNSILGIIETVVVGVLHAPRLIYNVYVRVQELLSSSQLPDIDQNILLVKQQEEAEQLAESILASNSLPSQDTLPPPLPPSSKASQIIITEEDFM